MLLLILEIARINSFNFAPLDLFPARRKTKREKNLTKPTTKTNNYGY